MDGTIVYMSHGATRFHHQTVFSIYSLLHWLLNDRSLDIRIAVFTDQPDRIPLHEFIRVHELTSRDLSKFKGPTSNIHRPKLAVLAKAVELYPGPMIYVDCDTKWLRSPASAFTDLVAKAENGNPAMYMHIFESELGPDIWPEYYREFCDEYEFQHRFAISKPWQTWNSGVIGLHDPGGFFDEARIVCDEILSRTTRKNWSEQLAVSLLGNTSYNLQALDSYLRHYWRHTFTLPYVVERALNPAQHYDDIAGRARYCAEFAVRNHAGGIRKTLRMRIDRVVRKLKHSVRKRRQDLAFRS